MRFEDFVSLVSEMRSMQKAYFKTRDKEVLFESKRLEGLVDKTIKNLSVQKVQLKLDQDIRGFIRIDVHPV